MQLPSNTIRKVGITLLVGFLMTTAGCSALQGGASGDAQTSTSTVETTELSTQNQQATAQPTGTNQERQTQTPVDDSQEDQHSQDGHSHSHANESADDTGKMAVLIAGERVDLRTAIDGTQSFHMVDDTPDEFHVNGTLTLVEALERADVDATAQTVSYDGDTYRESTEGTNIVYRVNGEPVDPSNALVDAGDEVWVVVQTEDSEVQTGEYIPPEQLHAHGDINFTVEGERVDFSREKYQQAGHNDFFHFEGGHANPWHAHSGRVTLGYGLSTLEGINATDRAIVYDNETYEYGSEATVRVNGETVRPNDYVLKDGDTVRVVLESTS